ncbi:uncharacterized protein B0T15DRAFT_548523 [Chaetomium strumarium]|uniref:PD-(D/E)XK nuclease-like domain-containing protein n=1 Tax=Chaetomium strumarium TaxID=1170767 RepID=A0AAJ0H3M9_9PEZI|nr:hypothetical protein B0T15DRAFT_548523 [Chaetomium strumarium]
MSNSAGVLSLPRPPPASSSTQSTTTGSRVLSPSRRSKSPVKKVADLRYFTEPVTYCGLDDPGIQLPAEIQDLSNQIAVVAFGEGSLPTSIKARLLVQDTVHASSPRERIPDFFFGDYNGNGTDSATRDDAIRKDLDMHAQLMKVIAATRQSVRWTRSEAAWNLYVHSLMLELALATVDNVRSELITTAQILSDFLPLTVAPGTRPSEYGPATTSATTIVTSQEKMVDFAFVLDCGQGSPLHSPFGQKSINHSDYGPLYELPAPIAVEAKTATGSEEEEKVQLGVWTAAWFRRMKMLVGSSKLRKSSATGGSETDQTAGNLDSALSTAVISVPLLLVVGERWMLFYACEKDNRIIIYGSDAIGDTSTVLGVYKLLRALQCIGRWITAHFLPWFAASVEGLGLGGL